MTEQKTKDMENGFLDHGVAIRISSGRGTVATVDGAGRDVVLAWLHDARGCPALLMIDADTGASEEYPIPFPSGGDSPFASLLSTGNKFYSHFNSRFVEFDPVKRAFTAVHETVPKVGMGMTEDDQGRIWVVTYPNSGVMVFDPNTGAFRDYGPVYAQNWRQYQRQVVADDKGWIYFSVGNTLSQIIAFEPVSGVATPMLAEAARVPNVPSWLHRAGDGKVYGIANDGTGEGPWYMLYDGKAVKLDGPVPAARPMVCGTQGLFHRDFPSGKRIRSMDFALRELVIEDPGTQEAKTLHFDYTSEGAHIMGVAVMPDGTVGAGTAFPMRLCSYHPETDSWKDWEDYGQPNTMGTQGNRFFLGEYTHGMLVEWDPSRPLVNTRKEAPDGNPRLLTECEPVINRPHALLLHPDGKTVVMGGTPGYGYTGGGLLFWDRGTETRVLLEHTDLLVDHCVMSLVALPEGKLLVGSGTRAGTGGEVRAKEAELYVVDMASKKIEWHAALIPGVQEYSEMRMGPDGLVYGIADFRVYEPSLMDEEKLFFVFDPACRKIVYQENTAPVYGSMHLQQGQRKIVVSPKGTVYLLFRKGIASAAPVTHKLAWVVLSPVSINAGGDWLNGRIYFTCSSHLYSYQPYGVEGMR